MKLEEWLSGWTSRGLEEIVLQSGDRPYGRVDLAIMSLAVSRKWYLLAFLMTISKEVAEYRVGWKVISDRDR